MHNLNHLTDKCEHHAKDENNKDIWCQRCEEGCQICGELDGINDEGRCEECQLNASIMAAESFYEGDR